MDIESRAFWEDQFERLEKIKKFTVGTPRHDGTSIMSFYAKLRIKAKEDPKWEEVLKNYEEHFGIFPVLFGENTSSRFSFIDLGQPNPNVVKLRNKPNNKK